MHRKFEELLRGKERVGTKGKLTGESLLKKEGIKQSAASRSWHNRPHHITAEETTRVVVSSTIIYKLADVASTRTTASGAGNYATRYILLQYCKTNVLACMNYCS